MAQSGAITLVRNSHRDIKVVIVGVLTATNSPPFQSLGYPIGSFTVQGTFQTSVAATVQLQGSNDSGVTWFNQLATGITSAGSTFTGSFVGVNNEIFEMYQFLVTGGDGGTNLNFFSFLSATFG